jgi:hypothetical protein
MKNYFFPIALLLAAFATQSAHADEFKCSVVSGLDGDWNAHSKGQRYPYIVRKDLKDGSHVFAEYGFSKPDMKQAEIMDYLANHNDKDDKSVEGYGMGNYDDIRELGGHEAYLKTACKRFHNAGTVAKTSNQNDYSDYPPLDDPDHSGINSDPGK